MKRVTSAIVPVLVVLCMLAAGCSSAGPGDGAGDDRMVVGTTILPLADFITEIGGDHVEVVVMVPPGASPATYAPTIDQMVAIGEARLYVKVGSPLPFETAYLGRLTEAAPGMQVIDASEGIAVVEGDPHIWTSPKNARVMAGTIAAALEEADPAHAADYRRNAEAYGKELAELDDDVREILADADTNSFMVYHPAWAYFAREYGLTQIAIEQDGKEPDAVQVRQLIATAEAEGITVVFASPQFSTRSAEVIAGHIGGHVVLADPLGVPYTDTIRGFAEAISGA